MKIQVKKEITTTTYQCDFCKETKDIRCCDGCGRHCCTIHIIEDWTNYYGDYPPKYCSSCHKIVHEHDGEVSKLQEKIDKLVDLSDAKLQAYRSIIKESL